VAVEEQVSSGVLVVGCEEGTLGDDTCAVLVVSSFFFSFFVELNFVEGA